MDVGLKRIDREGATDRDTVGDAEELFDER